MIVVTGAYGFIGSCIMSQLNKNVVNQIIAVDDLTRFRKTPNLVGKESALVIDRVFFLDWFKKNYKQVEWVIHLGARTDTTEFNYGIHRELNFEYSKKLFTICEKYQIGFLYASSAATYGNGEFGFSDADQQLSLKLKPLNPYGVSKNEFDKWLINLSEKRKLNTPWFGFKFFNVYGPNEYHKGRMASTIFHFYNQITKDKSVHLFESHKPEFANGEQKRDFIYVKDVLSILEWFLLHSFETPSGIYNVGTGVARSFKDVVKNVFHNLEMLENISYVPTPPDIRDTYQYFTQADTARLRQIGKYNAPFFSLEEGITDYVKSYLLERKYL